MLFKGVIVYIIQFLQFNVVYDYSKVSETESEFPAISFCNLNSIDFTQNKKTSTYLAQIFYQNGMSPYLTVNDSEDALTKVSMVATILKTSLIYSLKPNQVFELGFSLDRLLISCFFNDAKCNNADFYQYYDFAYGNCYTFNSAFNNDSSRPTLTSTEPGFKSGLVMEIFTGSLAGQDNYTMEKGIVLSVHNRGEIPLMKYNSIKVAVGDAASISLTRSNYTKLSYPFSSCRSDVTTKTNSDSIYYNSTLDISELCMHYEHIQKECLCRDPRVYSKKNDNMTYCITLTSFKCADNVTSAFHNQLGAQSTCTQACPLECNTLTYLAEVSTSAYPSDYYADVLRTQPRFRNKYSVKYEFSPGQNTSNDTSGFNPPIVSRSVASVVSSKTNNSDNSASPCLDQHNPLCIPIIQASILKVTVFYAELSYTDIQDTPQITTDTLVGVIGGNFGLFMGASFMSFAEVIDTLISLVSIAFKCFINKKFQNKKVDSH